MPVFHTKFTLYLRDARNVGSLTTVPPNARSLMFTHPILHKTRFSDIIADLPVSGSTQYTQGIQMDPGKAREFCLNIFLFGPICVLDGAGTRLTPKNQKSKAALAMLALAPRGSRSRVWLRDKLWSDRGEDQASASLRQALLDIRKSLGPNHKDILHSDKYAVTLNLSRVTVDAIEFLEQVEHKSCSVSFSMDTVSEHFLEGFDICDPEFESWLMLERQIWGRRFSDLLTKNSGSRQSGSPEDVLGLSRAPDPVQEQNLQVRSGLSEASKLGAGQNNWAIGLQAMDIAIPSCASSARAALLADKLTRNLYEMGRINVVRTIENHPVPHSGLGGSRVEIPLLVRISEIRHAAGVRLTIEIATGSDGVIIWSAGHSFEDQVFSDPACPLLNGLASRTVNQIGEHLKRFATNVQMAGAGQLIGCINQIFRLSASDLNTAEETLATLLKQQPSAQIYAWMAFAKSFQVGQRFTPDAAAQISEAQYYATRALEEDEFDPLVLSLAAHIHSYLFCEYDMAASLFERALKADPEQTIGWDLYAMLHAYTGQEKKSLAMASWAQHLGANTPFSYYFDTTKCIAAALAGDHKGSVAAGERAMVQRPKFNSILRYLISCHAHLGNVQMVESLRQRLIDVEPDFSTDVLRGSGYPGLTTEGGRRFLLGLRKAGFGRH